MTTTETRPLIDVAACAKLLGFSESFVHKQADANDLPFETLRIGNRKRFRPAEVEAYVNGLQQSPVIGTAQQVGEVQ